jgi:hypothetical protein
VNRRISKSKRSSFQKNSTPQRSSSKGKNPFSLLRQRLNSVIVWVLVAVNAVLLASLVHRLLTPANPPDVSAKKVLENPLQVEVLNGCGVPGVANSLGEYLTQKKFDIVKKANAPTMDYQKSVLIDRGRTERKQIDRLRETLGLAKDRVLPIEAPDAQVDATFIIGADYESLKAYKDMR